MMQMAKKENGPVDCPSKNKESFLQILMDMEEKNEKKRTFSGSFDGPFSIRANFSYRVRMGLDDDTR
jgi:hypothetical protein